MNLMLPRARVGRCTTEFLEVLGASVWVLSLWACDIDQSSSGVFSSYPLLLLRSHLLSQQGPAGAGRCPPSLQVSPGHQLWGQHEPDWHPGISCPTLPSASYLSPGLPSLVTHRSICGAGTMFNLSLYSQPESRRLTQ